MSQPQFTKDKSVLKQVLGLERLAEEYRPRRRLPRTSSFQFCSRAVHPTLRQHLQLSMDEGSTYSTMREKVINYESTTASWNSSTAYKEMEGFNKGQRQERWKGEAYGKDPKGKGKGKIDGKSKGKQFDTNKGKSFKSFGKQDGEGKETGGLAHDACKLCGARGHWSRQCPVCSLRQVANENETPAGSPANGGGAQSSAQGSRLWTWTLWRSPTVKLQFEW